MKDLSHGRCTGFEIFVVEKREDESVRFFVVDFIMGILLYIYFKYMYAHR